MRNSVFDITTTHIYMQIEIYDVNAQINMQIYHPTLP